MMHHDPQPPGRHEATAERRRRFAVAELDAILGMVAAVVILVVVAAALGGGGRRAAASESSASCRRADDAWKALVDAGEQHLAQGRRIDAGVLHDPRFVSLYTSAQRAHVACRSEGSR